MDVLFKKILYFMLNLSNKVITRILLKSYRGELQIQLQKLIVTNFCKVLLNFCRKNERITEILNYLWSQEACRLMSINPIQRLAASYYMSKSELTQNKILTLI